MSIKPLMLKHFRSGAASNATSCCNVTTLESPAEEHECIKVQQRKPMSYHAYLGNG